jgi:putative N-acetylmannosamine-6-phosphate epimerase
VTSPLLERLRGGLIVSCQAQPGSPLRGPRFMAAFGQAASLAGAVGVRADGPPDVRALRRVVDLPIIGISKRRETAWPVYITPTRQAARGLIRAGADIVALDATHRPRRGGYTPEDLIAAVREGLGCPVMADIDSVEEGLAAAAAGADLVATTLAGYTERRPETEGPDLTLVRELAARVAVPVVCEGRIRGPEDVRAAFVAGAFAVVVGTAITNPVAIAERFVRVTPRAGRAAAQVGPAGPGRAEAP